MISVLRSFLLGTTALACGLTAQTTSIRIEQTVEAQFPAALAFTPITYGDARVVINVDADGRLADLLVTGYTHRAFADEAVRLCRSWRYTPASVAGVPVGARAELHVHFTASGRVVSLSMDEAAAAFAGFYARMPLLTCVCAPRQLDRPVTVMRTVSPPSFGEATGSAQPAATVLLDFYVDENGRPRMPVVLQAAQDRYARAAVWALNQWQFAAPTCRGKPVAVRVRQEFLFPGATAPAADRG